MSDYRERAIKSYDRETTPRRAAFYGTRISPNQIKTEEDYTIYLNVPIARVGEQEYLPSELGLTGNDPVILYRPEEEVFAPEAIASFEGKIVTDEHPADMVNADNASVLLKGVVLNVRRGQGDEADLLLADLIVYDRTLNEEIQNGKREISSGYYHDIEETEGRYYQRNIRGNHVAVVPAGRAGPRVSIKDAAPQNKNRKEIKTMSHKAKWYSKILGIAAKDADPDAVAEVIDEISECSKPEKDEETPPPENAPDPNAALMAEIKKLSDRLAALENPGEKDVLDELAEEIKSGDEEGDSPESEETVIVDAGEENQSAQLSRDAATALIKSVRPVLDSIKDDKERKAAKDSFAKSLRQMMAAPAKPAMAKINEEMRKAVTNDAAPADESKIGIEIRNKFNPHYAKK